MKLESGNSAPSASDRSSRVRPGRRWTRLGWVFVLVAVAWWLRARGLADLGLGFNEPIHIYPAMSILETGVPAFPSGVVNDRAQLFTYTVALSFKLFGVNAWAARLPSLVFNVLTVGLVFLVADRYFGRLTAVLAALMTAFSPFEIVWARACRMYSMYQFFFLSAALAFYRGFENGWKQEQSAPGSRIGNGVGGWLKGGLSGLSWPWLAAAGALMLVAVHLQPQGLIFGAGVLVYGAVLLGVIYLTQGCGPALRSKYFLLVLLGLLGAALIVAVPTLWRKIVELATFMPPWAQLSPRSPTFYLQFLVRTMFFPILAFFVMGAVQALTRANRFGAFCVVTVAVPLLYHSLIARAQSHRYIYDIMPMMFLMAAWGLAEFLASSRERLETGLLALGVSSQRRVVLRSSALAAVGLGFALLFYYPLSISLRLPFQQGGESAGEYNGQWRQACDYINTHRREGEVLVVTVPLAAQFHGCLNVDFILNNGEIDQFRKVDGEDFLLDVFSNARAVTGLDDLRRVMESHPRGWLALDRQRFDNPATVPEEVRAMTLTSFRRHSSGADESIHVFSWDVSRNEGRIQ